MEEALIGFLLSDGPLAALVGNRIHDTVNEQGSQLPRLRLSLINSVPAYADDGEAGITESRIQIDTFAPTRTIALSVSRAVFARLSAVSQTIAGVDFQTIEKVGEQSTFETPPDRVDVFRVRQDFMIWHTT
ncbi:MAG: DUF3168 domain-containing protein [Thermaurantiacus sp.]